MQKCCLLTKVISFYNLVNLVSNFKFHKFANCQKLDFKISSFSFSCTEFFLRIFSDFVSHFSHFLCISFWNFPSAINSGTLTSAVIELIKLISSILVSIFDCNPPVFDCSHFDSNPHLQQSTHFNFSCNQIDIFYPDQYLWL